MAIQTKNPATGDVVKTFSELTDAELEAKLARAESAYASWKKTTFAERAKLMMTLAEYLDAHASELGELMSVEMGKVKAAGEGEVKKCASVCRYYAEHAEQFLASETVATDASESYVSFEPLGAVLAVMPWNFPFWQVYRFAAPALMAGNVGLLKHASNVPQCAEAIEASFIASGFPEGVFQNLLLGSARVEKIIRDPRVKAVTLTGSEKAGSEVAKVAGEEIKKTVLELGGSDPFIVCDDADVARACEVAAATRMQNNAGQSCIAAKRFIVHTAVADAFTAGVADIFKKLVVGDPRDPGTQVGPLATEQILRDIEQQVSASVAKGACIVAGGTRIERPGYFYAPTVLADVQKGMPAYDEETFGPVIAIITVANDDEAIRVANDTPYGLGATVFTRDANRAKRLAGQIEAGAVFVNGQVKSDPKMPFGGIKRSGYGRELSQYGIREFVNVKSVWIA